MLLLVRIAQRIQLLAARFIFRNAADMGGPVDRTHEVQRGTRSGNVARQNSSEGMSATIDGRGRIVILLDDRSVQGDSSEGTART